MAMRDEFFKPGKSKFRERQVFLNKNFLDIWYSFYLLSYYFFIDLRNIHWNNTGVNLK